jgi:integrase
LRLAIVLLYTAGLRRGEWLRLTLADVDAKAGVLRGYTGTGLSNGLRTLLQEAEVQNADGIRPRIHEFRHSFAVQAMLRWYRQGADVQANLPKLAMYLGHVSIVSTAYYLQWIPALAQAASQQFEAKFGTLIQGDKP